MFNLKRSLADKLFSEIVRLRSDYKCERCFTQYHPPTKSLHCSHFFGRKNKSVRWDLENAAALCFGCHKRMESNPYNHAAFFEKRLGSQKYDALVLRAHQPVKVDEKLIVLWLKEELKNLKSKIIGAR